MWSRLDFDWTEVFAVAGVGVGAIVAFLFARRVLGWFLGPIFGWETVRLARKGSTFWLRSVFALLLLGMIYATKPIISANKMIPHADIMSLHSPYSFDEDIEDQYLAKIAVARFAEQFSNAFLLGLAAAAILIVPLYFGTAITEEKEKRSIDFLLTTHLKSREIILGRFSARVLNLCGVAVAGIPILALTQLWGGVDWKQVARGLAVIAATVVSYGALSMLFSVLFARTRTAVIGLYCLVILINVVGVIVEESHFGSPIMHIIYERDARQRERRDYLGGWRSQSSSDDSIAFEEKVQGEQRELCFTYLGIHAGATIICLAAATALFRPFARRHAGHRGRVERTRHGKPSFVVHPLAIAANPPIRGNPLIWKERHLGRTWGGWLLNTAVWYYYAVLLVILGVFAIATNKELGPGLSSAMRIVSTSIGSIVLIGVGLRMAASVSREREQQTLVSLLATPLRPFQVLWAKWVGSLYRSRRAILGFIGSAAVVALAVHSPIFVWIFLPLNFLAHLWFVGNLGLFLSIVCRSTNRALSILLGVVLCIVACTWATSYFRKQSTDTWYRSGRMARVWTEEESFSSDVLPHIDELLSPPGNWWYLMGDSHVDIDRTGSGSIFFAGGFVLWLMSAQSFRRQAERA